MGIRPRFIGPLLLLFGLAAMSGCASVPTHPAFDDGRSSGTNARVGMASWYGKRFHGRRTASGVPFDQNELTCAHPSLPFGTRLRVTNLANSRTIVVTVNDRGPYAGGRIIDLSYRAAKDLGFISAGTAKVRVEVLPRD